jgi:hypothetical protein
MAQNTNEKESMTMKIAFIIISLFIGSIATSRIDGNGKQDEVLVMLNKVDKSNAVLVSEVKFVRQDIAEIKEDNKKQDEVIKEMQDAIRRTKYVVEPANYETPKK